MKTVKYTPMPGVMVPGWKTETREITNDRAAELLRTGQFTDVTPKPSKPKDKPKEVNE